MKPRAAPARLGVVIFEDVEPIDIGGAAEVVSMARRVLPHVGSVLIAREAGPVRLGGGMIVLAEYGFANAPTRRRTTWRLSGVAGGRRGP